MTAKNTGGIPTWPSPAKKSGGEKNANTAGTAKKRLNAQKKSMPNSVKNMDKLFS